MHGVDDVLKNVQYVAYYLKKTSYFSQILSVQSFIYLINMEVVWTKLSKRDKKVGLCHTMGQET